MASEILSVRGLGELTLCFLCRNLFMKESAVLTKKMERVLLESEKEKETTILQMNKETKA